ncbi:MAG: hypothetical protein ABJB74_16860 [Gemmatimonas sp.]
MLDNHDAHRNRADAEPNKQDARKILTLRPIVDREVPLPNAASQSIDDMPGVVQQWLDGDVAERIARRSDDSSVEFWNKISVETSRRRRTQTPAMMSERVMAVLPKKKSKAEELFYRRFKMSPLVAFVTAVALIATGVIAGEFLLH